MSKLYGRAWKILISDKSGSALDVSNLHCIFKVKKAALATPGHAELTIYNLAPESSNILLKDGYRLIIEAGYQGLAQVEQEAEGRHRSRATQDGSRDPTQTKTSIVTQYGKIFDGTIVQMFREREDGTSNMLQVLAIDGDSIFHKNFVSLSIPRGQTQAQVLTSIAANATTPTPIARVSPTINPEALPRGKVVFGDAKDYLKAIAYSNKSLLWVNDGSLNIEKITDEAGEGRVLEITPKSGLVGSPQQTNDGITFKVLLNPRLHIMTLVKLNNELIRQAKINLANFGQSTSIPLALDADGQYKLIDIYHSGDTRDLEWYTTVSGVGMVGKIPTMLSSVHSNPI